MKESGLASFPNSCVFIPQVMKVWGLGAWKRVYLGDVSVCVSTW